MTESTANELQGTAEAPVRGAKRFWKSLEEVEGGETFEQFLAREYPSQSHVFQDPPQRREFMKLMGASLALAGVTAACTRQPKETIYAYAKNPETTLPGKPMYFATTMPWAAGAIGLVVESHEGRPTKIEGNELHSGSLGATDAMTQATVLGLYDNQRSQTITERGTIKTWNDFAASLKAALGEQSAAQGAGLRILTGAVVSPTLAGQIQQVLAVFPKARWVVWEPVNRDNARRGAMQAFGRDVQVLPDFAKASVVLSLEADFLSGPEGVRNTKAFAKRRKVRGGGVVDMNRLYVAESAPSITGASADHHLPLRSSEIDAFARKVARALGVKNVTGADGADARMDKFAQAVAKDLAAHKGASLVVAGSGQPPHVHALAHAMNAALGNVGKTLVHVAPAEFQPAGHAEGLQQLVQEMNSGAVQLLLVSETNPVYTAPAELDFAGALAKVKLRAHHGLYQDETAMGCDWHVNAAHFLESWSDGRAADGTLSIVQPLILPLYNGKTAHDLFALMLDKGTMSAYDLVREQWQKQLGADGFEAKWRRVLHDGVLANSQGSAIAAELQNLQLPAVAAPSMELTFTPDPSIHDGRFALNGWLQELPKPLTKLTWDNVAQISPATAERLGVKSGDVVELEAGGRKITAPAWIQPGQADDSVQIALGFGRKRAGSFATDLGSNAYALRTTAGAWAVGGLSVRNTGEKHVLASTQGHDRLDVTPEGIPIAARRDDVLRVGTIDRFRQAPDAHYMTAEESARHGEGHGEHETSIYAKHARGEYAWGMVIDLNACTACNACVVACQSENNIPVVGKKEILRGREMHWIRIDRYFDGERERPKIHVQPIPCMQCENAPCETVCPVAATAHGPEGLNEMTYNRCVGTRYCANNCPYKVRRFNFFLYSDYSTESLKLGRNPDVTVRSRGVMEKCTYCVQRINRARLSAHKQNRKVQDGEIVTACQQVCPADAITFGNVDEPTSQVAALKREPHNYGLLAELNTFPRTTFLGKVTNPNPELEPSA
ncbi:MAG: TAT-variant-translocated molybdopterin oxidoreductase [Planctomycetes bacterium]|nr:TAT-variant-translocated molybdopterin oxidoreductase [Planctomycetota bacterium]